MIALILGLAVLGLLVYLIETYIPMPDPFKLIIRVVVTVCAVYYLLQLFGIFDLSVPRISVGR